MKESNRRKPLINEFQSFLLTALTLNVRKTDFYSLTKGTVCYQRYKEQM